MTIIGANVSARDLLLGGHCTSMCLLGREPNDDSCLCRCDGRWHGVLIDAHVPSASRTCLRCERGACEKCLDRWRAWVPLTEIDGPPSCACGCWGVDL